MGTFDLMALERSDAAQRFVEEHGTWLVRCAFLLTGRPEPARDLAQDTWLKVWRSWDRVAAADDERAYVARIMMNAFRNQARRPTPPEVDLHERTVDALAATDAGLAAVDDADVIWRSMSLLSKRQRAVLVLRYWADLDDEAIGRALRCRRATVRSLARRGLATLREQLGDTGE